MQGFSHQNRSKLEECHSKLPKKPIYASECCSCNTMCGEDTVVGAQPVEPSFNADCQQAQTNASNGVEFVVGTVRCIQCNGVWRV